MPISAVNVTVRNRTHTDLDACSTILAAVHRTHRYPIHLPTDAPSWLTPIGMVAAWVAVVDSETVGHVCLVVADEPEGYLVVERLFVSPAAAGRGVGRRLLEHAGRTASHLSRPLALKVADNCHAAIALYTRAGWREIERTPIDWGDGIAHELITFEAP